MFCLTMAARSFLMALRFREVNVARKSLKVHSLYFPNGIVVLFEAVDRCHRTDDIRAQSEMWM